MRAALLCWMRCGGLVLLTPALPRLSTSPHQQVCGPTCDRLKWFVDDMTETASSLEAGGYTNFTPHFLSYECKSADKNSPECESQCIYKGRYCAPDPGEGATWGVAWKGHEVATENLRQLCVFRRAQAKGVPWLWWAYAAGVVDSCSSAAGNNFKEACFFGVMERLGFTKGDRDAVSACVGDVSADRVNPVMEEERRAQADADGVRGGEVVLLPTVVVNGKEYRGRLDSGSILKALCAGFAEGAEPPICLGGFIEARSRCALETPPGFPRVRPPVERRCCCFCDTIVLPCCARAEPAVVRAVAATDSSVLRCVAGASPRR